MGGSNGDLADATIDSAAGTVYRHLRYRSPRFRFSPSTAKTANCARYHRILVPQRSQLHFRRDPYSASVAAIGFAVAASAA